MSSYYKRLDSPLRNLLRFIGYSLLIVPLCILYIVSTEGGELVEAHSSAHHAIILEENVVKIDQCNCYRPLQHGQNANGIVAYNTTTCGRSAWARGSGQKVISYSLYGSRNSKKHKSKKYFEGVAENLELMRQFYPGWTLRLYYDVVEDTDLEKSLCQLACANAELDLCYIQDLPGAPVVNASSIFAMNWRFFPTLDPQVDLYLCRDLDSRISAREVAAVNEWINSGQAIHSMRDHPYHGVPMVGASWGARLSEFNIRNKWKKTWRNILADLQAYADRSAVGPDQEMLSSYVWSWGKSMSMQHDSYSCTRFPGAIGFPTRRLNESNNFMAAVVSEGDGYLWEKCPEKCRRKGHPDWEYC